MLKIPQTLVIMLTVVVCQLSGLPAICADSPCAPATLDRLPLLPRNVSVEQISSHNKKGLNGDAGWFLYKDGHGDAVIFDAAGPGCLRSFWETCIDAGQVFKFYFDGESQPRFAIPAIELFQGKHPLLPAPLVYYEKLGYYGEDPRAGNCFVPIPFAKSLKISVQGKVMFHHFIYERYPYGTPVVTFTGKEDRTYLSRAFARPGEELQPPADAETIHTTADAVNPGNRLELLNVAKAGTVVCVTIEGDATEAFLQGTEIEMLWDESSRPDVLAPLGMFFAVGSEVTDVRALPIRVDELPGNRVRLTSRFRMPFWHKGRIALVNRSEKPVGRIAAEVKLAPPRYAENKAGRFHAVYRDGRTVMGRDWLFCDAAGTGWFVGVVQTMLGSHYCEGDERFTIDGAGIRKLTARAPKTITWPASGRPPFSTSPLSAARAILSIPSLAQGPSSSSPLRRATTASIWTLRFRSTVRSTPASSTAAGATSFRGTGASVIIISAGGRGCGRLTSWTWPILPASAPTTIGRAIPN